VPYLVLRVPTVGPKALAGTPNDFATMAEAEARVTQIEAEQLQTHHTYLDIMEYSGDKQEALTKAGILF